MDLRPWVYPGLLLFGIGYTVFMGYAERRKWTEGYLSYFVAFGAAVTLGGLAILNLIAANEALTCFILSGLPMMVGDTVRYMARREHTQKG